jgi:hypothetical protein
MAVSIKSFSGPRNWSWIETAAFLYVLAPCLVFLIGWITPAVSYPLAAIYTWTCVRFLANKEGALARGPDPSVIFVAMLFAGLWVSVGGIGHFFYANPFDWLPRFALARDLTEYSWPVSYLNNGQQFLLRAPLGYYLFPALGAKISGLGWLDIILFCWTTLGVSLFFLLVSPRTISWQGAAALVLFMFASGADVIGYFKQFHSLPILGEHIEWWNVSRQYSSNTTLLFWVPNHTIAAWIASALLVRNFADAVFVSRGLPLLLAPLALWSPLSAAGFLPVFLAAVLRHCNDAQFLMRLARTGIVCLITGLPVVLYLTHGIANVPIEGKVASRVGINYFADIALFLMVEIAIFARAALAFERNLLRFVSVFVVVVLPFLNVGNNNDLAMRASIPALAVIWITLLDELIFKKIEPERRLLAGVVALFWLIGVVTPFQEFFRGFSNPRWAADLARTLPQSFCVPQIGDAFPPHYFASVPMDGPLAYLLEPPKQPVDFELIGCTRRM